MNEGIEKNHATLEPLVNAVEKSSQRQLALKIVIILCIGLLILIPINMVEYKVAERQRFLEQAKNSVAESWTGSQSVMTPIVVFPYTTKIVSSVDNSTQSSTVFSKKMSVLLPSAIRVDIKIKNTKVKKGIYNVPIYHSHINVSGEFSHQQLKEKVSAIKNTENFHRFRAPYITFQMSDMRGIDKVPKMKFANEDIMLKPGAKLVSTMSNLIGDISEIVKNNGGDISFDDKWLNGSQQLIFDAELFLRGTEKFSFLPLSDTSRINMVSNWPHPEFVGASLPVARDINQDGFTAKWQSTQYSHNSSASLLSCLKNHRHCQPLLDVSSGVKFIEPVDVYLQSDRSIKYAMLFIGLSFITFFIFENIKRERIHPIQYAFVGLAIAVFYLLLISLAEHIAFKWAYIIAAFCCSSLLLFYVRYLLKQLMGAILFFAMMVGLYSVLYVIVQAEDFALLMGAVLVFSVLSAIMAVTRHIDWYHLDTSEDS